MFLSVGLTFGLVFLAAGLLAGCSSAFLFVAAIENAGRFESREAQDKGSAWQSRGSEHAATVGVLAKKKRFDWRPSCPRSTLDPYSHPPLSSRRQSRSTCQRLQCAIIAFERLGKYDPSDTFPWLFCEGILFISCCRTATECTPRIYQSSDVHDTSRNRPDARTRL